MKDWLAEDWFTQDNISFILGIVGSVGTFVSLIIAIIRNHQKISCKLHYFGYSRSNNTALAYIGFVNRSHLATSIQDISLVIGGIAYPCQKDQTSVITLHHSRGDRYRDIYNFQLPMNLSPLFGSSGYFVFQLPKGTSLDKPTDLTFLIAPSRGKTKKIVLSPDQLYFSE